MSDRASVTRHGTGSALAYLLVRQTAGALRQVGRRTRGVKGILVATVMGLSLLFLLGPQLILLFYFGLPDPSGEVIARVRLFGPPLVLLLSLVSLSAGRGLYFRPAEIDLLFPAPIGRRALILYHLAALLRTVLASTLWLGLFTGIFMNRWYGGLLGIFCALAFVQLVAAAAGLAFSAVAVHLARWTRRALSGAIIALVLYAAVDAGRRSIGGTRPIDVLAGIAHHPGARFASMPMRPFVELFLAQSVASALIWSVISFAVLAALFLVIATLDVAFEEGAVRHSQKMQEKLRRLAGGLASPGKAGRRPWSLPQLPRWAGVGPLVWRQLTEMSRSSQLIWSVAIVLGLWFVFTGALSRDGPRSTMGVLATSAPLLAGLVAMSTQGVAFDFRRDLDRMAALKALPLSPMAVAVGQLLSTMMVATGVQIIGLTALVIATGASVVIYGILALLIPFNAVLAVIDNALFLYAPHRINPRQPADVAFAARTMLLLFVKGMMLTAAVAAGAVLAVPMYFAFGGSWVAAAVGLAAALVVQAAGGLLLVAAAFERFDIGRDIPA